LTYCPLSLRESEFYLEGVTQESRADLTTRTRQAMLG
jgi:hypothetical protein